MMEDWQSNWEERRYGMSHLTSCQSLGSTILLERKKSARNGPFPRMKRFNLASTANCPCGNRNGIILCIGYVTECILHITKPVQQRANRFRNVASSKGYRLKIKRLLHHLNDIFQELLRLNPLSSFTSSLFHSCKPTFKILRPPSPK
ncbi:hypothetical protein AVEN_128559-1 [Araneus ventricosus]|uniref:Uncharacterized protein n=1 Tax=Araneus ventricosus TaxID=182803 RepID=A0A4Y2L3E7_ARAVE|nr:hypothetical protein AVEN_128559-1 [Araneus ventricosus]